MEKLKPTLVSALALGVCITPLALFFFKYVIARKKTDLALFFMSMGWLALNLVISGAIHPDQFYLVEALGLMVPIFLFVTVFKVEFRDNNREERRKQRELEAEDRRLRSGQ